MITVSPVATRKELKEFTKFKIKLYAGNPYAVPPLYADEREALLKGHNPALKVYDHQVFLAKRDGKTVGRIVAIINHISNRKTGKACVRFGFIDFVEDFEVAKALIETVEQWGRERGMEAIHGPLGFTDFDRKGCSSTDSTRSVPSPASTTIPTTRSSSPAWDSGKTPNG